MIQILDATTKSLQAVMSGAAATTNPSFTAAWADDTGSSFTEGATDGALNGTTPVTLAAAPASSTRRIVRSVSIANIDTAPVTVTVSYNDNGTLRTIAKVTLAVGDTWTLDATFDTSGNTKFSGVGATGATGPTGSTGPTGPTGATGATGATGTVSAYPGSGIAVSTGSAWGTSKASPSGVIVGDTDAQTVTNKRNEPRTASSTTASTLTPDLSSANVYYRTTQTASLTINAPTGTPVIGEVIAIYIDSASAQTLTMDATYIPFGAAFPASTTAGKTLMIIAQYNGTNWKTTWAIAQ